MNPCHFTRRRLNINMSFAVHVCRQQPLHSRVTKRCVMGRSKTKPPPPRAYESDGDSDSDGPPAPVPLQSLEQGRVRDLVAEFEHDQALKKQQNKPTTKRARAELEQLALDKKKKQFRQDRAEKVVWRKFDRENRVFESYYRRQLGLSEEQWGAFVHALRAPLAVHVRVNGNYKSLSEIVTGTLELDFPLEGVLVRRALTSDGDEQDAPVSLGPVEWSPDKRAWKISIDSKSLRKAEKLRDLNTYVQTQVHLGTLQRLDPITAVIPAFLQLQPGHRVLDLCGGGEQRAPGVIERMDERDAPGVLVVNEKDAASAARAVQTLSRTLAISRSTIVTAHKPFEFPAPTTGGGVFDRVICSAPCSGDGLIRKIPERWRTWTPEAGLKSHAAQVALISKAMALVSEGGALLYCTRSLNPIENEAVVSSLLRSGDGAFELVDVSDVCVELERCKGLETWEVYDSEMNAVSLWETATPAQRKQLRASMWPPTDDEAESMHLKRCVRVLPHQNDTSAMFIALIRKVHEPKSVVVGPAVVPQSLSSGTNSETTKKQLKANRKLLGSLSMLKDTDRQQLITFFGMSSGALTSTQFMERSGFAKDSAVHVVSEVLAELVVNVFQGRLIIHRAGVEAFKKVSSSPSTTSFELTDDGARVLLPSLRQRVLQLPLDEFSRLLTKREAWLKHASESAREILDETPEGSLVVVLDDMEPMQTADQDLVVVAVKRHSSYSVVSTSSAIARVKTLMKELEAGGEDDEDSGYDSLEFED